MQNFRGMIMAQFLVLAVGLVSSGPAQAAHPVVSPFDEPLAGTVSGNPGGPSQGGARLTPGEIAVILQAGADHIVAQQCPDGGFGWPHDDCGTTYHNITAPILLGVLRAWEETADANHLAAAVAGGDFELTSQYSNGEPRFGIQTPFFFMQLSAATGDSTYTDFASQEFFDALTAGTYGPNDWDTAGLIQAVFTYRTGTWVNLRPWEFCNVVAAAAALGNPGQADAFAQAALDGFATLDNTDPANVYSDIIGIAGGIMALAEGGVTTFPAISAPDHPLVNGVASLEDLVAVLVSLQNTDGSWYWHSNLPSPAAGDEDVQTTAYAVMALILADPLTTADLGGPIWRGRDWLASLQLPSGGFPDAPGVTSENTEVEGEALLAIGNSEPYRSPDDRAGIPALGTQGALTLAFLMALAGLALVWRRMG